MLSTVTVLTLFLFLKHIEHVSLYLRALARTVPPPGMLFSLIPTLLTPHVILPIRLLSGLPQPPSEAAPTILLSPPTWFYFVF